MIYATANIRLFYHVRDQLVWNDLVNPESKSRVRDDGYWNSGIGHHALVSLQGGGNKTLIDLSALCRRS